MGLVYHIFIGIVNADNLGTRVCYFIRTNTKLHFTTRNKHTLDGEGEVALNDDVETSSYHVKDALDANFTYDYSNKPLSSSYGRSRPGDVSNRGGGHMNSGSRLRGPPPHQPNIGEHYCYVYSLLYNSLVPRPHPAFATYA